jgi:hypothetical protein
MGVLAYGIPTVAVCSSHCIPTNPDLDFPKEVSCAFPYHSFVQIGIELSALFILSIAGFYLVENRLIIPNGFFLSLFKPPRFLY